LTPWKVVARLDGLPEDEPVGVEVGDVGARVRVALVRHADCVYAVADQCPHRGAPFSELGLVDDAGNLVCGWHYWAFRLADGAHTVLPDVCLRTYPTRVVDGDVWVHMDQATSTIES